MPILTGHKFHIGPLPQIGMTFQHRAQFFQPDPLWVWAENDGVRVPHSNLVDRVLLPANKDIVATASALPDFSILVEAVVAAGLVGTLQGPGPFTVFAPTNAAFSKLPSGTVDNLLKPENKAALAKILTYHVVAGKLEAADLKDGQKLKTVEGDELTVRTTGGKVTLTDAKGGSATVAVPDVGQSNGVIHVIDTVLMPAS